MYSKAGLEEGRALWSCSIVTQMQTLSPAGDLEGHVNSPKADLEVPE